MLRSGGDRVHKPSFLGANAVKPFQPIDSDRLPRRAFLIMPFVFAGLVAVSSRKERPLPNAAQDGSGPDITLVIFSDNGERKATVQVKKS